MTHNQDWVLARRREEDATVDPPKYTVEPDGRHFRVWISLAGYEGWHTVERRSDGYIYDIYPWGNPFASRIKCLGSGMRRKIEAILP